MSQIAVDVKAVEALLITEDSVEDCVVRLRSVPGQGQELVAYVVSGSDLNAAKLRAFLENKLPRPAVPGSYVQLSALPVDKCGAIDEEALVSFPVIDSDLAERWEATLNALPEIERAAVVIQEKKNKLASLHLSDLLGEKEVAAAGVVIQPTQTATPTPISVVAANEKLALSDGGPLERELPATMAQALRAAAQEQPGRGIVYLEGIEAPHSQSYAELLEEAERILAGFRELQLQAGDKVILQLESNRDFVPAFWACALGGFVAVPISIAPSYKELNATITKLYHTWQMLDHPIVLTNKNLAPAITRLPALLQSEPFRVATIEELRTAAPDKRWHESDADDVVLMLLTSGSTGLPKGVLLSHRNILSRSAGVAQLDEFSSADVLFNWFPLDHVGGIVMYHTLAVYLKAKQLLAPTDMILQEPLKWLDVADQHSVSITWAPNFAFGLVNDNEEEIKSRHWDLSSLRFILNGGEAIVAKTSRKFLELLAPHGLPLTAMNPAWGMSETSSGITSSHKFQRQTTADDQSFVEVGGPIPGASLRIVDAHDNLVAEEKIGRLQVKGTTITRGYYKNEELNHEAFSPDGWFNTGDLGFLKDGCLTITGRTKDVIIINGINFYSHEIEGVVEEVRGVNVSFTAATAVREQGIDTDRLAIFFNAVGNEFELTAEIRAHVLNRIGINPDYIISVEKEVIPKTAIGKIQRQQLRDRFEAGEFKDRLKQLDIESGNARTIPDWFFRKDWSRREELITNSELLSGSYLVFADELGLADKLCRRLRELGNRCVLVEQGSDFQKLGADRYRLNPGSDNCHELIESMMQDGPLPNNILHLWHYTNYAGDSQPAVDEAQRNGIYTLLETIKALAATPVTESGCRLLVISNHTQPITPNEQTEPAKATVLGFLKTLPLELSWLAPRHLDLQLDQPEVNAERVCRELTVPRTRIEVAYREGNRLVSALGRVKLLGQAAAENPLEQGGLYLITGGLGGVGAALAQFLIQKYDAKLILIGKTPLPPCEECAQHDQRETELGRRLSSLMEMSTEGQVCYEVVDACDLEGLRLTVARAEKRWRQKLAGVFHLAGGLGGERNLEQHWTAMDSHRVTVEALENFQRAFAPKVFGTLALGELLKDRPESLLVLFSSVNSLFGGATFSAYSAANSFLDAYAVNLRRAGHPRTFCFNWTMWDDLGMSRDNPEFAREATRRMGFFIMSKEQALNSLVAGLWHDEPQLIVGVDSNSRSARRYLELEPEAQQTLKAYFTSRNGTETDQFRTLKVLDRFGKASSCEFTHVAEIALDAKGEVDRDRLRDLERDLKTGPAEIIAPRTELEREVAGIWRQVLRVPQLSVSDNFFQIGGQSLLATQVVSRLRKALGIDLPLSVLFESPTVAGLAVAIEQIRHSAQPKSKQITAVSRDKFRVKLAVNDPGPSPN